MSTLKVNPSDRKYLQALQAAARNACGDVRPTRLATGDAFRAEAGAARARRAGATAQTRADIAQARQVRDAQRAAARTRCDASRWLGADAKGHQPKRRASSKKKARVS